MNDLVTEVDNLMMRRGFGVDGSRHPLMQYVYGGNGYTVCVTPDSHSKVLSGGIWYSGSELNFSLQGNVKEGISESQYRRDMHVLKATLNEQFNGNGVRIDAFCCILPTGRKKIMLSNLLLDYKKETPPQAIADAVGLVQEQVHNLLRQYVE